VRVCVSHLSVLNKRLYEEVLQHTFGFSDLERQKNITLGTHCDTRNVGPTWPSWLRMGSCASAPLGLPLTSWGTCCHTAGISLARVYVPQSITVGTLRLLTSCRPRVFHQSSKRKLNAKFAMQSSGVRVLRCSIYKRYKRQDLHFA